MDILSSTLGNPANFNPTTTIDSVVSSLQLLATVASFVNVSWPENSPVKGSKLDFDEWAAAGHTNWNWESVLKYLKKAENMLDKKLVNGPTSEYHCDKGPFSVKPQIALTKPESRGRVTLRSTNPFDPPKIFNNFFAAEEDLERMIGAVKKIKNLESTPEYSDVDGTFIRPPLPECDDLEYQSEDYWACYVKSMATTIFHPASTCAMGLVVDNNLKVKGIKKLSVADDSIMPFIPRGTTAMVSIMIAEKAADIIKKEHGKTEGFEDFPCPLYPVPIILGGGGFGIGPGFGGRGFGSRGVGAGQKTVQFKWMNVRRKHNMGKDRHTRGAKYSVEALLSIIYWYKENMLDKKLVNGPTSEYHCDKGPFSVKPQSNNELFVEKNRRMLKGYSELGMNILEDPFVPMPNGTGELYLNIKGDKKQSRRASTAEEYLLPIKNNDNFHILKEAQVIKILINDNKEAIGVRIATKFGRINVYADVEVILCAGVFNSAKLLLLSGIGPKKDLERLDIPVVQDLPVGENLQDHVFVPVVLSGQSNVISALDTVVSLTELSSFPAPIVSGFFSSSTGTLDLQHITVLFGTLSPLIFYIMTVNFNYNLEVSTAYYLTDPEKEKIFSLVALTKPESRGRVTLRSANPFDPPKIFNNFFAAEKDLERMIDAVKKIKSLENTPEYSDVEGRFIRPPLPECDDLEYHSEDYWACYVKSMATTIFHPASTCAMGLVVDNNLKVKGIKKLSVADDSIMPFMPRGTTGMVSIMIAEKAADIIKKEHGKTEGFEDFPCD
ncbi:hypothetical protein MSG28_004036 [Choristoneura fumiferana]|uniref:Uncharacterized protein n=1 Tax=Choristoneura fumiferana TaxID=7141 RepID=A0ACC0KH55_CHOFU|nr:hypothetical protein MSG28_004036 [Choristoneura fumiferana]